MAIKWKNWTARRPVKMAAVLLVPLLAITGICGIYQEITQNQDDLELLFADLNQNHYIYNRYLGWKAERLNALLHYDSEEAIRDGEYLYWETPYSENRVVIQAESWPAEVVVEDNGISREYAYSSQAQSYSVIDGVTVFSREEEPLYILRDSATGEEWDSVYDRSELDMEWMESRLIARQLGWYREAEQWLEELEELGLLYYLTDGDQAIRNVPEGDEEWFTSMPVHMIMQNGNIMRDSLSGYRYSWGRMDGTKMYLAFDQSAVNRLHMELRSRQEQMRVQVILPLVSLAGALVALIVLLLGAGRRYGVNGQVFLTKADRPFLDIGFLLMVFLEVIIVAICAACFQVVYQYYGSGDYPLLSAVIPFCAVFVTIAAIPALWWLTSLAKHIKAGKWWRHTLCFAILYHLRRLFGSLWAGSTLTLRAVALTLILLVQMAVCMILPPLLIVVPIEFLVLCLWNARKLYLLEEGAEMAVRGQQLPELLEIRGIFRNLAETIYSFSDGINAAVEGRMKSEHLKTELITNVSHDIRTPLTSLITYTDLLRNEGLDSEKAPEYLDVLIRKSQRLKVLTDELFEAAKAATGNVEMHLEYLDLPALIRQSMGEMDERVRDSNLTFLTDFPDQAVVYADGRLLARVVENLFTNAIKYSLPGTRVYIDVTRSPQECRMDVKNISAHPLNVDPSELTERFTRGDSARSGEGSGLGLSIVQSFVQNMKGLFELSIDGDLFKATVILPARPVVQEEPQTEQPVRQSQKRTSQPWRNPLKRFRQHYQKSE